MRRGRWMSTSNSCDDAAGAARQQHDPVAEADGLAHVVGDEHDREAGLLPQPLELVVEEVAGHGVEGAEGLVHQQDVGVLGQRPGQRDPLAHAARQLVGPLARRSPPRCTMSSSSLARSWRSALGTPRSRRASSTLPRTVSQGNSADSWNMSAGRGRRRRPCPAVGWSSPASRLSSVLLPQPEAPTRQTNSPGATSREMRSRATAVGCLGAVDLGDVRWTEMAAEPVVAASRARRR